VAAEAERCPRETDEKQVTDMDFRETIEEVHTVATGTANGDCVYVLTVDGWRCYRVPVAETGTRQQHAS
jgi:hypothetical protein